MALQRGRFHEFIIDRNFVHLKNKINAVELIDHINIPDSDKQHIMAEHKQRGEHCAAKELLYVLKRLYSGMFVEFVRAMWLSPGCEHLAELLYNEVPRQYQDLMFRDVIAEVQQHHANIIGPRNQQLSAIYVAEGRQPAGMAYAIHPQVIPYQEIPPQPHQGISYAHHIPGMVPTQGIPFVYRYPEVASQGQYMDVGQTPMETPPVLQEFFTQQTQDFCVGPNPVRLMPSPVMSQQRADLQHSDSDDQSLNCSDTSNQSVDENSVPKSMALEDLPQGTVDELTDLLNQDELWRKLSKTVPRREVKRIGRDNKNPALALIDYLSENEWTVERFCQEVQDCVISPARERIQRILGVASPPGASGNGPRSIVQEEGANFVNIPLESSEHKIKNITPESPEEPRNNISSRIKPFKETPQWMYNVDHPGLTVRQNKNTISSTSPLPEQSQRQSRSPSEHVPSLCRSDLVDDFTSNQPDDVNQTSGQSQALDNVEDGLENVSLYSENSENESVFTMDFGAAGASNEFGIQAEGDTQNERAAKNTGTDSEHLREAREEVQRSTEQNMVSEFGDIQMSGVHASPRPSSANLGPGGSIALRSRRAGDSQGKVNLQNPTKTNTRSTKSDTVISESTTSGDESRLSGLSDTSATDGAIGVAYFTTDNVDNDMQAEDDNDDSRPVDATRHDALISNRGLSSDEGKLLDTSATADRVIRPSSSAASGRVDDDAPQIGQDVDDSRQGNATRQDSNDDHESEDISTGQPYIYWQQFGMFHDSETSSSSVKSVPELSLREDRSGDFLIESQSCQGRCATFEVSDHTGAQPIMRRWSTRVTDSGVVPDVTREAIGEATYSSQTYEKTSAVEDDDVGAVIGQVDRSSPAMAAKFDGEDKNTRLKTVEPIGTNSNVSCEEEILTMDQNVGLVPGFLGDQPSKPYQTNQQLVDTTDEQTELPEGEGHSVGQDIGGTNENADLSLGLVPGSFEDQTSQSDHTDQQEVDTADDGTQHNEGHPITQDIGGTDEDADPSSGLVPGSFEDQTSPPDHTDQQEVANADNGTQLSEGYPVAQGIGGMDEDADSFEDLTSQSDHTYQQVVDTVDDGTQHNEGHPVAQGIGGTDEDADPSSGLVPGSFEDQTSQSDHTDQQVVDTVDNGTQLSEGHPVAQGIGGMDKDADSFEDQTSQSDHTDQQVVDTVDDGTQHNEGHPVAQGIGGTDEDADPSSGLVPGSFEDQTSQSNHTDQQVVDTVDNGTQLSEGYPVAQGIGGMDEDADSFEDQTSQSDHTDQQVVDTVDDGTQHNEGHPVAQHIGGMDEDADPSSGLVPGSFEDQTSQSDHTDQQVVDTVDNGTQLSEGHPVAQGIGGMDKDADSFEDQTSQSDHTDQQVVDTVDNGTQLSEGYPVAQGIGGMDKDADSFEDQTSQSDHTDQHVVDTVDNGTQLSEGYPVAQGIGGMDEDADSFEEQTSQSDHTDQQVVDTVDDGTQHNEGHPVAQDIGGMDEDADPSSGLVPGSFEDQTSQSDHTDQQVVDTVDNGTQLSEGHPVAQGISETVEGFSGRGPASEVVLDSGEDAPH